MCVHHLVMAAAKKEFSEAVVSNGSFPFRHARRWCGISFKLGLKKIRIDVTQ